MLKFRWFAALIVLLVGSVAARAAGNRLADGDFERRDLKIERGETPGIWAAFIHAPGGAKFDLVDGEGHNGSRCVRYTKTAATNANIHFDQIAAVAPNTVYEVRAWVRGDGHLNPMLAVLTMKWASLTVAASNATADWREVRLVFDSRDNTQVRFEWFPGATGKLYTGVAGTSYLDDVSMTRLDPVPEALRRGLDFAEPQRGEEIDPAAVHPGAVGDPHPLRPITCRDGVLRYDDGSEVALWGVNFQTALSWEYQGRLKPLGIPLNAAALNRLTDENFAHFKYLGVSDIRLHLLPSDFSDAEGNLRDTPFLDALNHVLAKCHEDGIYVYLTLVNDMHTAYCPDSFMVGHDRSEWLFDEDFVHKTQHYVAALLQHKNRYTHLSYAADPAIAVIEITNEPSYLGYTEIETEPKLAPYRAAFDKWLQERHLTDYPEVQFAVYRYELVRRYLDEMCDVIRRTGSSHPIVWNLNWPRMINGHEDVFQAAADSRVDAVSFCLYPGQSDVPSPYWNHPMDLGGKNYLPFLRDHYLDYSRLRWALGKRFAGKAKVVYEFETFYNQTTYLYPAMAALFRSLGVQMAQMWQYGLSPAAEYLGGSHYLNLYCTPRKAVSFRIAAQIFKTTPRFTPFALTDDTEIVRDHWAVSFSHDRSLWSDDDSLMYSGALDWKPLPIAATVRHIVGYGSSPIVEYDGTGAYFVDINGAAADITILPDSSFVRPPWQRQTSKQWVKTCLLDPAARHRVTLHLPGFGAGSTAWRIDGAQKIPVPLVNNTPAFDTSPGTYRVTRQNGAGR